MWQKTILRGNRRVVAFSSLRSRLEWRQTLDSINASSLHLFDDQRFWWHSCIEEVNKVIEEFKPDLLVGSSMGGYGALLFGSLHNIRSIAFGPQTTLNAVWDRRWAEDWERIRRATKYPAYLDLQSLELKADIYYCAHVYEDRWHAERVGGNLHPQDCLTHAEETKGLNLAELI